jgi:hypothetical protein
MHHILIAVFSFIIVYGFIVKKYLKNYDVLEKKFAKCEGCDLWALTHFTMYFILAYFFPRYYVLLFIIGVLYEVFEYVIGRTKNSFKYLGPMTTDGDQSWWYGRVSDIVFNTFGIITGVALSPY